MQSEILEEALRFFRNRILSGNPKIDTIVLSPSLLGGLLEDPRLKDALEFSFGEDSDPDQPTVLVSDSFTQPYGVEWIEVGEDPEITRQELLEHRITGSLKLKIHSRKP